MGKSSIWDRGTDYLRTVLDAARAMVARKAPEFQPYHLGKIATEGKPLESLSLYEITRDIPVIATAYLALMEPKGEGTHALAVLEQAATGFVTVKADETLGAYFQQMLIKEGRTEKKLAHTTSILLTRKMEADLVRAKEIKNRVYGCGDDLLLICKVLAGEQKAPPQRREVVPVPILQLEEREKFVERYSRVGRAIRDLSPHVLDAR